MSPHIRDAIEVAAGVGGTEAPTYRSIEIQRKPTSITALRHRLIAFLQEVPEDMSVRELLDDLRDGLHFAPK